MSFPTLASERLILRGFDLTDAPIVQKLAGEFAIADTTLTIPHPYDDGIAEQWIERHAIAYENTRGVTFAITLKGAETLVGAMSIMGIERGHQAELGYWIGVPYWGQGYCSEAGKLVVAFAFGELGLFRLHARHFSRNPASGRVLTNLGFKHEGTRIGHVTKWGHPENVEDYGLIHGRAAGS